MKKSFLMLLLFFILSNAQVVPFNQQRYHMMRQVTKQTAEAAQTRNPFLAGWLSGLVPGAGQAYNQSYWKAALFLVAELGLWTGYVYYDHKGKDEDQKMRAFGDAHWSPQRYWSFIYHQVKENEGWKDSYPQVETDDNGVILDAYYTDELVEFLRSREMNYGTHSLPRTKTQQYYEMIYKYLHQFGAGWDDVPNLFYYAHSIDQLTPHISRYRDMRNLMNDYYDLATDMVMVVMVNHLFSAFEAAYSAKKYKESHVTASVQYRPVDGRNTKFYALTIHW